MRRTALSIISVVVILIVFSAMVLADEPALAKDYNNFEGARWEVLGHFTSSPYGWTSVDLRIHIEKIAEGKIAGTYTAKAKQDRNPTIIPFSSKVENTPDGLLRFYFKGSMTGMGADLQTDGSLKLSNGALLKRIQ